MQTIPVDVKVDRTIQVDVEIEDVIEALNEIPIQKRWNFVAKIINGIHLDLSDTTTEQKALIEKYLTDKIAIFKQ